MENLGSFTADEILEFYCGYFGALFEVSQDIGKIARSWTDVGVRVSFDKNLAPFVGASLGFNEDVSTMRKYLQPNAVLEGAGLAIENFLARNESPIPGGRFFLHSDGIYKKFGDIRNPKKIISWDLLINKPMKSRIDERFWLMLEIAKLKIDNVNLKR